VCLRWNNSQRFINLSLTWVMASYGLYIPFNHLVTYITLFIGLNLPFWCSTPTQTPRSRITANIAKIDPHCIPRYVGKWQDYLYMFYLLYIYIYIYIYICVCVCSHFWCLSSTIKSIWNPIRSLKSFRSQCGFSIPTKASSVAQNVALGVAGTWQKGHHMLSNSAWRDPWSAKAYVCTSTYFHTHTQTHIYGKGIYMCGGRARLRGPGGSMKHQFHPYI